MKIISRGVAEAKKRRMALKKVFKENDAMWSRMVKILADNKSEKPATQEELERHSATVLNSHHIYHKQQYAALRWDVRNGVCIYNWQHVMSRGSAHDDPIEFDQWAIPWLKHRGDFEYLKKKSLERMLIRPLFIKAENARLREQYLRLTGKEFVYGKKLEVWDE